MDQAVKPPQVKHRANQRLLKEAEDEVGIAQLECAFVVLPIQFGSYEIKRVFTRFFKQVRSGIFAVSIKSRGQAVDEDIVEIAEAALHKRIEDAKTWLAEKALEAETLCGANGIRPEPKFLAPLKVDVKVFAALQREYLEALTAADHLIGLIEILAINGTIKTRRAAQEKSAARSKVRSIPGYVHMIRAGMQKVIEERVQLGATAARQLPKGADSTAKGENTAAGKSETASPSPAGRKPAPKDNLPEPKQPNGEAAGGQLMDAPIP